MTIHSMTGYGEAEAVVGTWAVKVSMKAVNHKNLDVRIRMDRQWGWLEPHLMSVFKAGLGRGRIDVQVDIQRELSHDGQNALPINEDALRQVVDTMQSLSHQLGLSQDLTWRDVLSYRHLFEESEGSVKAEDRQPQPFVEVASLALERFVESRRTEGATIEQMMLSSLDVLFNGVAQIEQMRPKLLEDYRQRVQSRVQELLTREHIQMDEDKLLHEVVFFADRTDIAEEIQRANAHIERLRDLFAKGGPLGKKLDFYLQEMIRETNTMASKSNFSDLTAIIVEMKTTVEQMREQAANIE